MHFKYFIISAHSIYSKLLKLKKHTHTILQFTSQISKSGIHTHTQTQLSSQGELYQCLYRNQRFLRCFLIPSVVYVQLTYTIQ